MSSTNVYVSTDSIAVSMQLTRCGPNNCRSDLAVAKLEPNSNRVSVLGIGRSDLGNAMLDLAFFANGSYIASLGVLVRGETTADSFSKGIWWRWRTSAGEIFNWTDDHDPHETIVSINSENIEFSICGESSFLGRDDIAVKIRRIR